MHFINAFRCYFADIYALASPFRATLSSLQPSRIASQGMVAAYYAMARD